MKEIIIEESKIVNAASEGMDAFVDLFVETISGAIGHTLTTETLSQLNADQATLLAYHHLREEVMDGGFVQLIHNGYGDFVFFNPFAKMMRTWGIDSLATLINKARKPFTKHREEIMQACSDEEFMALFERFPVFDDLDDQFVENEENWTEDVARYIDEHIDDFARVIAETP
ncbi:MAG: DMP19 family protein [Prevotella sp.]|nr:DMP19 family protein [Prevotella sp.]